MDAFKKKIFNIYGDKSKAWFDELPRLVADISLRLALRELVPVSNLSYNYVLSGFQDNIPVILKLSLDNEGLSKEAFVLRCFSDFGAVKVITEEKGLLLLERATPGISLKNYFPSKDMKAIDITCNVLKKLHQAKIPSDHLPHIKDWLSILDKTQDIPKSYLQKARALRDQLLATSGPNALLHGDLHQDNILQNGNNWVVIDPKGLIGEPAYEIAAFIRNPIPELLLYENASTIIYNRIERFAHLIELSSKRILDWCFVQAVLAWVWALEDGGDDSYFKNLTKFFGQTTNVSSR